MKNTESGEPMFSERQMVDIHFLELSKLKSHKLDLNNPLDRWAAFLKSEDANVLEDLKSMDKIIEKAMSELELAQMTQDERTSYFARRNQIWAHNSIIDTAIKRGTEKGWQQGLAEGKAEGKAETLVRLAKKRFPEVNEQTLQALYSMSSDELDRQVEMILDYNSRAEFETAIALLQK